MTAPTPLPYSDYDLRSIPECLSWFDHCEQALEAPHYYGQMSYEDYRVNVHCQVLVLRNDLRVGVCEDCQRHFEYFPRLHLCEPVRTLKLCSDCESERDYRKRLPQMEAEARRREAEAKAAREAESLERWKLAREMADRVEREKRERWESERPQREEAAKAQRLTRFYQQCPSARAHLEEISINAPPDSKAFQALVYGISRKTGTFSEALDWRGKDGLIAVGPQGAGKMTAISALLKEGVESAEFEHCHDAKERANANILIYTGNELSLALSDWDVNKAEQTRCQEVDVLIVNELDSRKWTSGATNRLLKVLKSRSEDGLPTFLTVCDPMNVSSKFRGESQPFLMDRFTPKFFVFVKFEPPKAPDAAA